METDRKQRVVDQEATNAQTLFFVADREAEIASQADNLAKKSPDFSRIAALAREHRKNLMEMAREERRLATSIKMETGSPGSQAAAERQHRQTLLEIANAEGRLASQLLALESDDPTIGVLAEQAMRNQALLRHVAGREREAEAAIRHEEEEDGPRWT